MSDQSIIFKEPVSGFEVITDLHNAKSLKKISIDKIKRIWIATDSTEENLHLQNMLINELNCRQDMMVLADDALMVEAYQFRLKKLDNARGNYEYINLLGYTARKLLIKHPPVYPRLDEIKSTVHLCIVGSHPLCAALLVDSIRHCVYSDDRERCLRITWFGHQVEAQLQNIYSKHPILKLEAILGSMGNMLPLAKIQAIDCLPSSLHPDTWVAAQKSTEEAGFGSFTKIYICEENDTATHLAAQRLIALQDVCNVTLSENKENALVACLSLKGNKNPLFNYTEFDLDDEWWNIDNEAYPGEQSDINAFAIFKAYKNERKEISYASYKKDESLWSRWSSKCSADHKYVKEMIAINELTENDAEKMARIENRRWLVERLLNNWLLIDNKNNQSGSFSKLSYDNQNKYLFLNNKIVPVAELSESEREKDVRIVSANKLISS